MGLITSSSKIISIGKKGLISGRGVVGGSGEIPPELRALFNVDDVQFSNGDVLRPPQGVLDGLLNVVDTSTGTVKVVSNKLELMGSGVSRKTGAHDPSGIVRALGEAVLFTISTDIQNVDLTAGLADTSGLDTSDFLAAINFKTNNDLHVKPASSSLYVSEFVASTDYEILILIGGADSNGVSWKIGDAVGDFLYGSRVLIRGGVFTSWTLLWADKAGNDTTEYLVFDLTRATTVLVDNIYIPPLLLDPDIMFQPLFLDTMGGSGSLDERQASIDVDSSGNGWTQRVGDADWRIDTGTAELGVTGTNPANDPDVRYVFVDVGASDFTFEADVKYDSGGNGRNGVMFRGSPETGGGLNIWEYQISFGGDEQLVEIDNGSVTVRDSGAHGLSGGDVSRLTIITNGTTIRCYRDGVLKLSFTSSFNQTATQMGLKADGRQTTDKAFDNVVILPTTNTDIDAEITRKTKGLY